MAGKQTPKILIIEGAIGAGKSVLTNVLYDYAISKNVKAVVVNEPVSKWVDCGILEKFYKDRRANAYAFQTYAFVTRCEEINKKVAENPDAELFIIERSPASDQVFMYLMHDLLDNTEKVMYKTWIHMFYSILKVDLTQATAIYLQTDINDCMDRLTKRGRAGENMDGMREYQTKLIQVTDEFLLGPHVSEDCPTCPYKQVVVISPEIAGINFKSNEEDKKIISELIFTKCNI